MSRRAAATWPSVADELRFIKSMYTDQFNHAPAELLLYTGSPRPGRPSMGSWVTYGLGSENENLPGFVVLISSGVAAQRRQERAGAAASCRRSTRACSAARGATRSSTSPTPTGMDRALRRLSLDALRDLNEIAGRRSSATPRR